MSTAPFSELPCAFGRESDYQALSATRWKIAHDYGMLFYCPASRAKEHLQLHHHILGVEMSPGIVRTRRNLEAPASHVILSGALYFVSAGSTIEVRKEQPMEYLLATVDPGLADCLFAEAGWRGAPSEFSFNLTDPSIAAGALQIRSMFLKNDADLPEMAAALVRRAVLRLLISAGSAQCRIRYQLARHRLRAALEFINENLASALSVESVAQKAAGISGFHFAHAFTAALGQSPHQYILECRMSRARELLTRTNLPLADIAYSVGFSSQSHMTNSFCTRLGVTPGWLRRKR